MACAFDIFGTGTVNADFQALGTRWVWNQIWNRRLKKTLFHSYCCFSNINSFKSLRNFLCFYIYFLARIVPQYQLWSVLKSVCLLSNFLFLRRKKRVAFVPLQTACLCFLVAAFTSPATHSLSFKNLCCVKAFPYQKRTVEPMKMP